MLRNRSWASVMEKARSRLELISRLWSFLTLFMNPSGPLHHHRGFFLAATTRRPLQGRTQTRFPSISPERLSHAPKRTMQSFSLLLNLSQGNESIKP